MMNDRDHCAAEEPNQAMDHPVHGDTYEPDDHDLYDGIEHGIEQLLTALPSAYILTGETLTARLHENIHTARLHGDTQQLRSERSRIQLELNRLSYKTLNKSFIRMCNHTPHFIKTKQVSTPTNTTGTTHPHEENE